MQSFEVSNKEAFLEIQGRGAETSRALSRLSAELHSKETDRRRNELTINELKDYPNDTRAFAGVGRMFLLTPLDTLQSGLISTNETLATDVEKLSANQKYLEKQLKDYEAQLEELIIRKVDETAEVEQSDDALPALTA